MALNAYDNTPHPQKIGKARRDGTALRNDGIELKPIAKNPWYVIATVFGEQTGRNVDWDLHEQNRRMWNGWACSELHPTRRIELAAEMGLPPETLEPLTEEERILLENTLRDRLGETVQIPNPKDSVDLTKTYAPKTLVFEKFVFPRRMIFFNTTVSGRVYMQNAMFMHVSNFQNTAFLDYVILQNSTFSGRSDFANATFFKHADFVNVTYSNLSVFQNTTFMEYADFAKISFAEYADFEGVNFNGNADFQNAKFAEAADFENATFNGTANFKKATFTGNTIFSNAAFETAGSFAQSLFLNEVPRFYKTTLHPDTKLSIRDGYWPAITAQNAERSKNAYTRLRKIMTDAHKPDEEHFFHRRRLKSQYYLETGINKWTNWLFEKLSDYGHSIIRPIQGLCACIIAPVVLYMFYFADTDQEGIGHAALKALGLSFSSTFNIFGFLRNMYPGLLLQTPFWLNILSGAQMLTGLALICLLLLGLRTRFRMR